MVAKRCDRASTGLAPRRVRGYARGELRHTSGMSRFVPSTAIDECALIALGASGALQSDHYLLRCPACARIFVGDDLGTVLYVDGRDLSRSIALPPGPIACPGCGATLPARGDDRARVTWDDLGASDWSWLATPMRAFGDDVW